MGSATFVARTHHQLQAPPRPHPSTGDYPGPDARLFANRSTNHCPISGVPPWTADQHPRTPRQGWPLTSAPRGGTPGSQPGSTAGALRSGSRCSWPVALNQMLGVKRGESQSSAPPQYRNHLGKGPRSHPAPCCPPESAGFAPEPPLLPLPQLSRPPGAKSWLLESMDPGCRQRDKSQL